MDDSLKDCFPLGSKAVYHHGNTCTYSEEWLKIEGYAATFPSAKAADRKCDSCGSVADGCLFLQGKVVVVVLCVACYVLYNLQERRNLSFLMAGLLLCLKNHKAGDRFKISVQLKVLAAPNKAAALLAYRGTVRVCLLQE